MDLGQGDAHSDNLKTVYHLHRQSSTMGLCFLQTADIGDVLEAS